MFQVARELPQPVIVTATSHLGAWQTGLADRHIITGTSTALDGLEHGLNGVVLITGEVEGERTQPIHPDLLNWLNQFCGYHAIPLLIEADGSRGKPLKAWAEHEPPIPSFVDLVVQVVGLSGVGKPLIEEYVHRVDIFSRLSGLDLEQMITPEALVQVLIHREGAARKFPPQVKKIALLNQADTPGLQSFAQGLSQLVTAPRRWRRCLQHTHLQGDNGARPALLMRPHHA